MTTVAAAITNNLNVANDGGRVEPPPQLEHRYHPQVRRPSNDDDTRQVLALRPPQIQHRYHPHSGHHHHHHHHHHDHHQHQHQHQQDHHPQESLLLGQFVEPPLKGVPIIVEPPLPPPPPSAEHHYPVVEEYPPTGHYGYGYGTPSYVTSAPIYFTTAFPTKLVPPPAAAVIEHPGVYTHYFLGNKLWYIPLYFGFAFVAFFGYIIIRDLVIRRFTLPPFARQLEGANEVLEMTIRVLVHLQKAAEIMIRLPRQRERPPSYPVASIQDRVSGNGDELHLSPKPSSEFHMFYQLGSKLWYSWLYYSFAFVIYVGYLLVRTAVLRVVNFPSGLLQAVTFAQE